LVLSLLPNDNTVDWQNTSPNVAGSYVASVYGDWAKTPEGTDYVQNLYNPPTTPSGTVPPTGLTTTEPSPTKKGIEVITEGGYDFVVERDDTGKIVGYEKLGVSKESSQDVSPDTLAGLNYQRERDASDLRRQQLGTQMEQANAYASTVWKGIQENNPLNEYNQTKQQELYDAYEKGKAEILNTMPASAWASKYLKSTEPNPYKPKQQTNALEASGRQLEQLKVQKDYYTEQLKALNKNIKDPENPTYLDTNTKTLLSFAKAQIKDADDRINNLELSNSGVITPAIQRLMDKNPGSTYMDIMQAASEYMNNPGAEGTVKGQKLPAYEGLDMETKQLLSAVGGELYYEPSAAPKEPELNIPDWMRSMLEGSPSVVKGRDTSKWAKAITPSGQGWASLVPSQRDAWADYAEQTLQGSSNDLVSSMNMQRPQNLRLGKSWAAAKGRY
jgi:hypothetical protein